MKRIFLLIFLLPVFANAQVIVTIAGNGSMTASGDGGPAISAGLVGPVGVVVDAVGNVYISCASSIRKIDTAGIITSIAGNGVIGHSGDGGPATAASLFFPGYLAVDNSGYVYFSEELGNCIRKVAPGIGGIITTIAGTGSYGYSGDGGPATAAELSFPIGIALDNAGNIYFSDAYNYRIRMINSLGIISTIAGTGTGGYTGDGGPATAAEIYNCYGIFVDGAVYAHDTAGRNVYIADGVGAVRKINTAGIITTVAGGSIFGFSGDGSAATAAHLDICDDIVLDENGNMYIADGNNGRIRKVDSLGIISTIAGNGYMAGPGTGGFSGDYCAATDAELHNPDGVAVDRFGNIYIADQNNHRIRKIIHDNQPYFAAGHMQSLIVCQNSISNSVDSLLAINDPDILQTETWSSIVSPSHGTLIVSDTLTSTGGTLIPSGLSYTPIPGYTGTDTFTIKVLDCAKLADSTTIYVTVAPCTLTVGASANSNNEAISIFPNPANNDLTILSKDRIGEVIIYNPIGQTVYSQQYNTENVKLQIADLANGIYFIKINGSDVRRFVKQ